MRRVEMPVSCQSLGTRSMPGRLAGPLCVCFVPSHPSFFADTSLSGSAQSALERDFRGGV